MPVAAAAISLAPPTRTAWSPVKRTVTVPNVGSCSIVKLNGLEVLLPLGEVAQHKWVAQLEQVALPEHKKALNLVQRAVSKNEPQVARNRRLKWTRHRFDHLPAKGTPYYSLLAHFISNAVKPKSLNQLVLQEIRRFEATCPQHASQVSVFISIIGTAKRLDEQLAHANVMEPEALHAAARHLHSRSGGCCTAQYGNVWGLPIEAAIDSVPSDVDIDGLELSYPVRNILHQGAQGGRWQRQRQWWWQRQ
ncbi:uncharacterized protein JCM10292_006877 [Rhodotorula paludigena]|uniref:uncharacterized protein n=1 Tax=Rhodotorula paludigena TaxID=86838 RepID=UPI003173A9CA